MPRRRFFHKAILVRVSLTTHAALTAQALRLRTTVADLVRGLIEDNLREGKKK